MPIWGLATVAYRAGGAAKVWHVDVGNHTVSHAQKISPMRIKFTSAATVLTLCLVFQVQANTLLGKVINMADED